MVPNIHIDEFDYRLFEERIAQFPLPERDKSKLLVYNSQGEIAHYSFKNLPELLPSNTLLTRNISKVLPARIFVKKSTGGNAEVLLVEPIKPSQDPQIAITSYPPCIWKAIVGGRRIRPNSILSTKIEYPENIEVTAKILERNNELASIEFSWKPENLNFAQILDAFGRIPLPPYIKRSDEPLDRTRYQTIYALYSGSVAAPTAGLHFTDEVYNKLLSNNIKFTDVTLHIGPGTFKPVDTQSIAQFTIHTENFSVSKHTIQKFYESLNSTTKETLIAIGTTSVRAVESLYWIAHELFIQKKDIHGPCFVSQWIPYQVEKELITPLESLELLLNQMEKLRIEILSGSTQLLILPGYKIKFFDGLITNFHLPKSTLLMLVASFIGTNWKKVYNSALENNYRFLSYGDTSLLYRTEG